MKVFLIYKEDQWHTESSKCLLGVCESINKCCHIAKKNGATSEQISDLNTIRQSQLNGLDYEFNIEEWEII